MANKEIVRFRLTRGRTPISFSIPTRNMMLEKDNGSGLKTLKKVHYIKGVDSIWVEDYKGDQKPDKIEFEDGYLDVEFFNRPLIELLKRHKWYNKEFEVLDEDAIALRELEQMELEEQALTRINVSNEDELMANALILIGEEVVHMSVSKVRLELKKKARKEPQVLLDEMNSNNYKVKYAGALGIQKGVILINESRTSVTWPDGKVIINVAVGQSPISKLGAFLSENTDAARNTLQAIGEGSKRPYIKRPEASVEDAVSQALEVKKENFEVSSDDETEGSEMTLEEAREMYKELNDGKEVPNVKKNDLAWILSKLNE